MKPLRQAENVLVEVEGFLFHVYFFVVNIKETPKLPLLLGRHFLAIARARIDVDDKILSIEVGDEKIIVNMDKFKKGSNKHDASVFVIETFDARDCVSVQDKQEIGKNIFKIETDLFSYDTPICTKFAEFNSLLHIEEDVFICEIDVAMSH
ncbi:reverse transcriptase domain-containing protein [Tanacetum coccineum]